MMTTSKTFLKINFFQRHPLGGDFLQMTSKGVCLQAVKGIFKTSVSKCVIKRKKEQVYKELSFLDHQGRCMSIDDRKFLYDRKVTCLWKTSKVGLSRSLYINFLSKLFSFYPTVNIPSSPSISSNFPPSIYWPPKIAIQYQFISPMASDGNALQFRPWNKCMACNKQPFRTKT